MRISKEDMLKRIYEKMSDKNLSTWCKIKVKYQLKYKATSQDINKKLNSQYFTFLYIKFVKNLDTKLINLNKELYTLKILAQNGEVLEADTILLSPFDDEVEKILSEEEKKENIVANIEMIGHPVMVWDILKYIEKNMVADNIKDWWGFRKLSKDLLLYFDNFTRPIDEQSEKCINYVYSLIK